MFKSYKVIKYLGYNSKNNTREYEVKIVDDNFEEIVFVAAEPPASADSAAIATIKIYSQKQLPVAQNLALCILFLKEKYNWKINEIIEYLNKYVIEFNKYKNEVEKILLFS